MLRRLSVCASVLALAFACSAPQGEKTSDLNGLPLSKVGLAAAPKSIPAPKMTALGHSLAKAGMKSLSAAKVGQHGLHPGRNALKKMYLKAVSDAQGIPRNQGEEVLTKLVSDAYGACDGLSCAKVFGTDPMEVPQFIDETFFEVAASPTLAKTERAQVRKVLLSSLAKDATLSQEKEFPAKDKVARIFLNPPAPIPKTGTLPQNEIFTPMARIKVGDDFIHAIEGYTGPDCTAIRFVESYTDQELAKNGWTPHSVRMWRQTSDLIHEGFKKLPGNQGTVYRGLGRLKPEQIMNWYDKMQRGEPIGLGALDRPALASGTWDPLIARHFAATWISHLAPNTYSVFMVIEQTRGLSIQHLSLMGGEREILLPRDAMFQIEAMLPASGLKSTIWMKLREIPVDKKSKAQKKAA